MIERKKKIKIIQVTLLLVGFLIIFFTYMNNENTSENKIISSEAQKKIKQQMESQSEKDIFYNIEYSGLDLAGNRYLLKASEAITDNLNQDIINMKSVTSIFYFKDGTVLNVSSETGVYNNKSLDILFSGEVKASYIESKLFADKAQYSNSEGFLKITKNVIIEDSRGTMIADELLFDIKKKTLNISSKDDKKINTNVNIK